MRHRIKAGKVGSFTPEKQKVEIEQLENKEVSDEVEEIFEEDSEFSNDDKLSQRWSFTTALTQWNNRNGYGQTHRTTTTSEHGGNSW